MGRNSKPLNVVVLDEDIYNSEALKNFQAKGHTIYTSLNVDGFEVEHDVVIGSKCRRIDKRLRLGDDMSDEESLGRQLEIMEKGERAIKYPKKKGEEDVKATK